MRKFKIIISGGGTGGHIYPAIAIANEFKSRLYSDDILFVGASGKMEMKRVPQEGYPIIGLWISGLQRRRIFKNLLLPLKIVVGLVKVKRIFKKFRPDIVIGTGGYASALVMYAAAKRGIPCFIQEQNSYPGITNKFLARYVKKIFVAYDNLEQFFPKNKMMNTGNPIRQGLENVQEKREGLSYFEISANKKTLLILGGSLGAKAINEFVERHLDFFRTLDVQLIWQCGELYAKKYMKCNELNFIKVTPFIKEMNYAYAVADMVISRAGAGAVSELCVVAKPLILVPSVNVAENHQYKNAKAIEEHGGAKVLEEKDLDDKFRGVFKTLLESIEQQNYMRESLKKIAKPNATRDIVNHIVDCL